jgi:hypothetical protein
MRRIPQQTGFVDRLPPATSGVQVPAIVGASTWTRDLPSLLSVRNVGLDGGHITWTAHMIDTGPLRTQLARAPSVRMGRLFTIGLHGGQLRATQQIENPRLSNDSP